MLGALFPKRPVQKLPKPENDQGQRDDKAHRKEESQQGIDIVVSEEPMAQARIENTKNQGGPLW